MISFLRMVALHDRKEIIRPVKMADRWGGPSGVEQNIQKKNLSNQLQEKIIGGWKRLDISRDIMLKIGLDYIGLDFLN